MNTPRYSFGATLLVVGILDLVALPRLRSDPLRLTAPVIGSNRAVELTLTGQVGAAYTVETSVNLSDWFLLSSGIATNGLLFLRHDAASNYPALFYRGKTNDSLPPLTVGLLKDPNLSVNLLVSLDGASGVLYAKDGTRFRFSLPSNCLPDPQVITMTLVTNLTGLPFASGTLGAVLIEPANLVFWGAATLEITFPTNVDRRQVVSFYCHNDGAAFQLTPDRVGTNAVVIPITRTGVFGSSRATAQELTNAARIDPGGGGQSLAQLAPAGKSGGIARFASSTAQCFPAKQAAAEATKAQLDAAAAAQSKEIAALLGAERQKQLLGTSDDSSAVLSQVAAKICAFYTGQVAPRWPAANNNCALGEVLTTYALALGRQAQLLGAPDTCAPLSDVPWCAIVKSCLNDVRDCCALGMRGPDKIAEVYGLLRRDQLLGLNCISQDEAQTVIDLCSPSTWSGAFSMLETGTRITTISDVGSSTVQTRQFVARFDGAVESAEEIGDLAVLSLVKLRVTGQFTRREFLNDTSTGSSPCQFGGQTDDFTIGQSEALANTNTAYEASFLKYPNSYLALQINNADTNNTSTPVTDTISGLLYSSGHDCDGKAYSFSSTSTDQNAYPGRNLDLPDTTPTGTNVVAGTLTLDDPDLDPPRHIVFKWSFTRRTTP